jgi:predicted Zn-dependent peptidase
MRFVIAGKLKGRKAEIKRQLESFKLPSGKRFDIPKDELHKASPAIIRRKDATNLTFGFFMAIPKELNTEELNAMHHLDHILTGTMHSRIFGAARRKGLAYNINSYTGVGFYDSGWDISGQVNHESADELFDIIVSEINNVMNGKLTTSEVEAAKSFALGRYQMGAQTVAQISGFYTSRYFADGLIKDYYKIPETIKNVTMEKMVETARRFIQEDKWVLAAVSSGEKQQISDLGDKLEKIFNPN